MTGTVRDLPISRCLSAPAVYILRTQQASLTSCYHDDSRSGNLHHCRLWTRHFLMKMRQCHARLQAQHRKCRGNFRCSLTKSISAQAWKSSWFCDWNRACPFSSTSKRGGSAPQSLLSRGCRPGCWFCLAIPGCINIDSTLLR